jgi:uncharacterized protein (TIGR00725 family)
MILHARKLKKMNSPKMKSSVLNLPAIKISVIGGSQCDSDVYEAAYRVGREIARNNALLVCGGLGGVMEAACRGAKDTGGITIGILPGEDENSANSYVDIKIPTGLGYARNVLVVKTGQAIIAVDGSTGTLSEIAYALTYEKPLIGLRTWNLGACCDSSGRKIKILTADSPEAAVRIAISKSKVILGIKT